MELRAKAVVQVTLEVSLHGRWGSDCPMEQIYTLAVNSADGIVRRFADQSREKVRLVGVPKVTAIVVDEEANE